MLNEHVTIIPSVGEKTAEQLELLNITKVGDLLFHFPFRYDYFEIKPITEIAHEEIATIEGIVVTEPKVQYYGRKKSRLICTIQVGVVAIKAVFFNQAYLKDKLKLDESITITGKWDMHRLQMTVNQVHFKDMENNQSIQPIYHAKGTLTSTTIKKLVSYALKSALNEIEEVLPEHYLHNYKIPNRQTAIKEIHQPSSRLALKHAKRRFIYEELFLFQLKMQWIRHKNKQHQPGFSKSFNMNKISEFISQLSFSLTASQTKVLDEILEDLKSPYRMNRLLQGDVGSGKTIVAAISLYANYLAGNQGALMVPTEILAEQHEQSLKELFNDQLNVALLTSSVKGKKRKELLEQLQSGEIDILIGTHALIQKDTVFHNLGLVIVDEQHRFGVEQRKLLRDKGLYPDVLFMTATPIPRTLSITMLGDMDVSTIDELPKGRQAVKTYWVKESILDRIYRFIEKEVSNGHQAYVICPLIEESDKLDIQNAIDVFNELNDVLAKNINVGLMHGRLTQQEKEDVMRQFANNEIQVLVSTTVVEVGVNVPNATLMVIYDAERFGLSQLHQLRGRVGRGSAQSYCILIADPKGDTGKERMRIMTETYDGFTLSEHDLELRGPGDFFGKKQSGLPEFKVADIVRDFRALEVARKDATEVIREDLLNKDPNYLSLKEIITNDPIIQERIFD